MARLARLYAPDVVQHVLQRPVRGRVLFTDAADYERFTDLLGKAVRDHAIDLHAYVLLPSQVRLLATPSTAEAIPRAMQAIGRTYVPYLNRKTQGGALWYRRYRSTLIDAERYLLAVMRHVEAQPVAESLVAQPADWRWSSHAHHVGSGQLAFVHDHAAYWALSDMPFERQAAYRRLLDDPPDADLVAQIDTTVDAGWVLGDAAFRTALDALATRRTGPLSRGRPRKTDVSPINNGAFGGRAKSGYDP